MSVVEHHVQWQARSLDLSTMNPAREATVAVAVLFTLIGLSSMALRVLTGIVRHRKSGYDDWVIFAAWLASIGFLTTILIAVRWGMGLDTTDAPSDWTVMAMKSLYASEMFYFTTIFLVKISLVFLYHRLACDLKNTFYYTNFAIMTVLVLQYISTIITAAVQCVPIEKYWMPDMPGRCIDRTAFLYAAGAFTIITDIAMIGLPVYLIWQVNRPRKQKIGVCAAFLIGGISTLASCVRLYSIRIFTQSDDPVRDSVPLAVCSLVEINLGILCASVPAMWPLFFHRSGMAQPEQRFASFSEESKRRYLDRPYRDVDEYIRQSYFGDRTSPVARPQNALRSKYSYTKDRQSVRPGSGIIAGLPDIMNFGHDPDGAYNAGAQRADDAGSTCGSRHIMIKTTFTMEDEGPNSAATTPDAYSSDDSEDVKHEEWA